MSTLAQLNPEHDENIARLTSLFEQQKKAFAGNPYPSVSSRIDKLGQLKKQLLNNQDALIEALQQDYSHRSAEDTIMGDIFPTLNAIKYAMKRVKKWAKPSKRHVDILLQPAKLWVEYQPLGVVGIVVPWNYPVMLSIGPLISAISAGNRALIKMSEFTPNTNKVIQRMISAVFSEDEVATIEGEANVAQAFTALPFDHVLFTGSTRVGHAVMSAAAQNLTPVTLELGGKSPTIIDRSVSLELAVSRLIFGKCLNAAQTCVAPDYILCPTEKLNALMDELQRQFNAMYPDFANNDAYSGIINSQQYQRLRRWTEDAQAEGASIIPMQKHDPATDNGKIPLTVIVNATDDMTIMKEEIFGPLLPIVTYDVLDEAIAYVNARPRPLALYLMSHDKDVERKVLSQTHSGGVCVNDSTFHVAMDDAPFGGIGPSGMGHYHGVEGFRTFSHAKTVLKKGKFNASQLVFPPYGNLLKLFKKIALR